MKTDNSLCPSNSVSSLLRIACTGDVEAAKAAGFEAIERSAEYFKTRLSQKDLEDWRHELAERIVRLTKTEKYRESFQSRLMASIGGKLMLPGRMSTLSMFEEEAGVKATWREFDAALSFAAFGDEKGFGKVVANVIAKSWHVGKCCGKCYGKCCGKSRGKCCGKRGGKRWHVFVCMQVLASASTQPSASSDVAPLVPMAVVAVAGQATQR